MFFKKILKSLKAEIYFTLSVAILAAAIGSQTAKFFPSGYNQSQLFVITPPESDQPAYYSQETARNFTDTAVALLQNAEFTQEILGSQISITVRKLAPQVIRITTRSQNPNKLSPILPKIAPALNSKMESLYQSSEVNRLKEAAPATAIAYFALNKTTLAAAGLLLGLLFSFLVVGLKAYFKL